jgi:hypothetical protein
MSHFAYTDDEAFVVPDEACDDDQASGNRQAIASSEPLKDVAAWRILKEFLDTDMGFGQMQAKLEAHLGSRYREEDWAEAKTLLFSGETDNDLSWSNVCKVIERHMLLPAEFGGPSSLSNLQPGQAWQNTVDSLYDRFITNDTRSSRVRAPTPSPSALSPLVPSPSELACRIIMRFIRDQVTSSHAYDLLEVEFSDDPTLMAHWESVLDAIVEADTPEDKLHLFTKLTSAPPAASDQPPQRVGVVDQPTSITQDDEIAPASNLPTWLVTVPCKSISPINMLSHRDYQFRKRLT